MYTPASADEASVNDASTSACRRLKAEAVMTQKYRASGRIKDELVSCP